MIHLEPEKLREIAGMIAADITPRRFPDDYVELDRNGEVTRIPAGKEVSMYRELEGIFVMIDGERLFFNQPAFAKFIFYCAKAGVTEVAVPEAKAAKKAVKGLEQEINSVLYRVGQEMEEQKVPEGQKREVLGQVLSILGASYYDDIVSEEDLW